VPSHATLLAPRARDVEHDCVYGVRALSPVAEIRLLAARELRRSVRSAKGIIIGIITLLGAFITSIIAVRIENSFREAAGAMSNDAFLEAKKAAAERMYGDASFAAYSASVPTSLHIFLNATVWLGPLLIALLGFDVMSSDLQHRSIRFWAIRTRRWSYFTGKTLGLWATVSLITLALNVIAGTVVAVKGYVTIGQLFTWGLRFWLVAVLIAGTWATIAALVSSLFRTPMLSLLTTFVTFFAMWLVSLIGIIIRASDMVQTGVAKDMNWYEYLYPNSYDTMLLSPEAGRVLMALGILLGFILLANAAGAALFQRRDI